MAKKQQEEEKKFLSKIALEERKILIAQRKLESMRLLEELFNRVKVKWPFLMKKLKNNLIESNKLKKVIVAQEDHEKYMSELKKEEQRRELEEANQEHMKRIKLEQEVELFEFVLVFKYC